MMEKLNVTLILTDKCNKDCEFCFEQKNKKGSMTKEIAEKSINRIIQNKLHVKDILITFFGGEPTLEMDLILHVMKYMHDVYDKHRVRYSITTNGKIDITPMLELGKEFKTPIRMLFSIHNSSPESLKVLNDIENYRTSFDNNNILIKSVVNDDTIYDISSLIDMVRGLYNSEVPMHIVPDRIFGNMDHVYYSKLIYENSDIVMSVNEFTKSPKNKNVCDIFSNTNSTTVDPQGYFFRCHMQATHVLFENDYFGTHKYGVNKMKENLLAVAYASDRFTNHKDEKCNTCQTGCNMCSIAIVIANNDINNKKTNQKYCDFKRACYKEIGGLMCNK